MEGEKTHSGFVAIVGKPNVGKSTLLNNMLGVKIAPITHRPQTTRRGVRGIYAFENAQAVFVDTPGLHKPEDALGRYMNQEVENALADVDVIVWVVDLRLPPGDEDRLVARQIRDLPKPLFVVGNKVDAAKYPDEALRLYQSLLEGREDVDVRALSAQNDARKVEQLRAAILAALPENPFFFPTGSASDQPRENWAAEIVREEAMKRLNQELPYAVATRTTEWTEREDGLQRIHVDVVVEKGGHKAIVIGKGGAKLKEIGQAARKQLEVFLNQRVYLELNVVVMPEWRRDPEALRELGYE
ncbi:GTP-binding protein Era [Deinobacterium chartae]|uniref:GTPase Era n=1 Tax=Deinobacterium chartae TaxID=521158 RepID=A0A841I282_9DEIO|nr:GTPase Era [Deinobacterium chartae]MBB6099931.1 GTP-binding protein Era [Deinobacterium chartae]